MKDYSNYHNLKLSDKIINDGTLNFNAQTNAEGIDVLVDGISQRVIIHDSNNPLNEFKQERKLMCLNGVLIKRGSIIQIPEDDNRIFIVTSKINKNKVYKKMKISESNCQLSFMIDGVIHTYPIITSRYSSNSNNIGEIQSITLPAGQREVTIPSDEFTKKITRNEHNRFIIENSAWLVIDVDRVTQKGITTLIISEQSVNTEFDNMDLSIADYWKKPSNQIIEPPNIPIGKSVSINGLNSIKIGDTSSYNCTFKENNVQIVDSSTWYLTADDGISPTTLATITERDEVGNTCKIQTNSKFKMGKIWLWVKNSSEDISDHVEIQIVARF
jgi:hypothetical protein